MGTWDNCRLDGVNHLYYADFGHFNITFTQAGGVNSDRDGLHHPVIQIEGWEGSLDIQTLADAYNEDGGNICTGPKEVAGTEELSWKCGFPKKGYHTLFGMALIPDDDPEPGFTPGWCTAHINQYQRNEYRTGARYRFDIVMFDADGKQIGHIQREEVDENGDYSMASRLPYTLDIHTGENDNDFVSFSYGGQSWTCDDDDGGAHSCTLGNGQEHGYENGDREGDMGWTCDEPTPPPSPPGKQWKFLVAGDSISHGAQDDWTWRWRLDSWLTQSHDVSFVGPYTGTHGRNPVSVARPSPPRFNDEPEPPSPTIVGNYAGGVSSSFTPSGHGAFWGRQAAQVKNDIYAWVYSSQPDYLLILLGFNDLGWFVSGPEGLIGNMGALVEAAREAKSDVKLLIGNVVDRAFIEGRQDLVDNTKRYNELLKSTMPNWFRWESPLTYIDVNSNYNCRPGGCPDGYDGLHPNAMGEYHIAQAFAKSLKADFGFDGPDFSVPSSAPARPISTPANIDCHGYPEGNWVAWAQMPNARGYEIRTRLQGQADWWSSGSVYPSTSASYFAWVIEGQIWEYQVRTKGDNDDVSDWTGSIFCTAHPKTAPAPDNIISQPLNDGLQVTWKAVSGYDVNRYAVMIWDRDTEGSFINSLASGCCAFSVTGLKAGHRYGVWVTTYVNMESSWVDESEIVGGLPGAGREVIIGGGTPGAINNIKAVNLEPTTVQLSWSAASGSVGGYAIYYRSIRSGGSPTTQTLVGTTTVTSYGVGYQFPGTWTYEYCVSAYNGGLESAMMCVVPPVYPGYEKRDVVEGDSPLILNGTAGGNITEAFLRDGALRELFQVIHHNMTAITMGTAPGAAIV